MPLYSKHIIVAFCLLVSSLFSQSEGSKTELFVKAGTTLNATQSVQFGRYDDGSHYATGPSSGYYISSINNNKLNNYSPYLSLGIYNKGKKWFGFYTGLTYTQYRQSFAYSSYNVSNLVLNTAQAGINYNEYDDNATGKIINHVIRLEFTPVVYIKKTKISFPFFNLDFVIPQIQTNLNVQRQYYQKFWLFPGNPINNGINPSIPLGSSQTVPVSISKNDFSYPTGDNYEAQYNIQKEKPAPFVYLPLSMKIEQEITISKTKWLIGANALLSPRARYYAFSFYIGYCIWSSVKI